MISFGEPPQRPRREGTVPMINVVFLLLIFFLMTASITPPAPFAVRPPEAQATVSLGQADTLYLGADGSLAFGEARDEAVFGALGRRDMAAPRLVLRADRAVPAAEAAALLVRLGRAGVGAVDLVVAPR